MNTIWSDLKAGLFRFNCFLGIKGLFAKAELCTIFKNECVINITINAWNIKDPSRLCLEKTFGLLCTLS